MQQRISEHIEKQCDQRTDRQSGDRDAGENALGFLLVAFPHFPGRKIRPADRKKVVETELKKMDRVQDVDPRQSGLADKAGDK